VKNVHCELYLSFPSIVVGITGMSKNPAKKGLDIKTSHQVFTNSSPEIYGSVPRYK
jgi:hypothetical protein